MQPSQMGRSERRDFRRKEPVLCVDMPRGKGGRLVAIPRVREGLDRAREFVTIGAYRRWSCPRANKALEQAARKDGRRPFTVYQDSPCLRDGASPDWTGRVADIQDLDLEFRQYRRMKS